MLAARPRLAQAEGIAPPLQSSARASVAPSAVLLGLAATPCCLVLSSSIGLYLDNQGDLAHQQSVLLPFLLAAGLIWLLGLGLVALERRGGSRVPLWAFLAAGPLALALNALGTLPGLLGLGTCSVLLVVYVVLVARLSRSHAPARALSGFALLAGLLLAFEGGQFLLRRETSQTTSSLAANLGVSASEASGEGPNIYHLLLDQYQTEVFEHTLALEPDLAQGLAGFTLHRNNVTHFQDTRWAVTSTLLGRSFDYVDQEAYLESPWQTDAAFPSRLRAAGYETFGLVPLNWELSDQLWSHGARHRAVSRSEHGTDATALFARLWAVSTLPEVLARRFVPEEEMRMMLERNSMPTNVTLSSFQAFRDYVELEPSLPAQGRYTFVHLILPHDPVVLDCDCGVLPENVFPWSGSAGIEAYVDQCRCANRLVLEWLTVLRELDRFDDSLIIVQGDHGSRLGQGAEGLTWLAGDAPAARALARAHALLLVKPPHAPEAPLEAHSAATSLLDLAPTVLSAAGLQASDDLDGLSLLEPKNLPDERPMVFHAYEKLDEDSRVAEFQTWTIRDQAALRGPVVSLEGPQGAQPGSRD